MFYSENRDNILKRFRESLPGLSDEALKEILRKRTYYDPEAAKMAVAEAINRGIISSEEGLENDPAYRVEKLHFRFFPPIGNPERRQKTIKSLSRGIFLTGFIPAIFGITGLFEGSFKTAFPALILGGFWLSVSFLQLKKITFLRLKILFLLPAVPLACLPFAGIAKASLKFMDCFAVAVVYILIYYSLLYILKLVKQNQ